MVTIRSSQVGLFLYSLLLSVMGGLLQGMTGNTRVNL